MEIEWAGEAVFLKQRNINQDTFYYWVKETSSKKAIYTEPYTLKKAHE
ncbi:MAG: hypothetical protein ACI978_001393 [Oleispira sp.]|jgi:hypothetical protein